MDSFKIILNKSSDINAKDKYGNTALHYAIVKKSKTKIKNLLKREGVDVNVRSDNTLTALHLASRWRTFPIDLFKLIIKGKSADINAINEAGDTALHLAIKRKCKTKVKELLEHKDVDVNVKDKSEKTALHIAFNWPNIPIDLFKLILEKSTEINAQDMNGDTALHIALLKKSKTEVKELLEHKDVDVNVKGNDNLTPLHLASRWKKIPIQLFKIVLNNSKDINAKDNHGSTSLHLAMMKEFETAVKELLAHKDVDVNVKDNNNQTALHLATGWRFIPDKLFEKIKEKSTDINAKDDNGDTALHMAINKKSVSKVKILLTSKDVDVNVKNKNNVTPIYCAFLWSNIPNDLFERILKKSADNINGQNQDN
jgi:ankyrin repeat protein